MKACEVHPNREATHVVREILEGMGDTYMCSPCKAIMEAKAPLVKIERLR